MKQVTQDDKRMIELVKIKKIKFKKGGKKEEWLERTRKQVNIYLAQKAHLGNKLKFLKMGKEEVVSASEVETRVEDSR